MKFDFSNNQINSMEGAFDSPYFTNERVNSQNGGGSTPGDDFVLDLSRNNLTTLTPRTLGGCPGRTLA
jgi:hypothetical protein